MKVRAQLLSVTALTLALSSVSWTVEAGQRRGSEHSGSAAGEPQGQAVRRGSPADGGSSRREAVRPRASAQAQRRDGGVRENRSRGRDNRAGIRDDRTGIRENRGREGRAVPRRAPDRWDGRDARVYRGDNRWDGRDTRWDRRNDRSYGVDRRYYRYAPPRAYVPRYVAPRVIVPRYVTPRRYYGPGGALSVYFGWGSGYRFGRWYTGRVYGYVPPIAAYGAYSAPRYYGDVRLNVRPRHAEVYVDGYYAGIVDDFDGVFQRLTVEAGRHEIEIVAPGYEPRFYEIYVDPTRTVELHGDLGDFR